MAEKEQQQAQNAPQAAEEKPPAAWGTRAWMDEVHKSGSSVLHGGVTYTPEGGRLPTEEQIAADAAARDAGTPRQQTLEARIAELEAQLNQRQAGEDRSKAGVNADRREATGGSAPGEPKGK